MTHGVLEVVLRRNILDHINAGVRRNFDTLTWAYQLVAMRRGASVNGELGKAAYDGRERPVLRATTDGDDPAQEAIDVAREAGLAGLGAAPRAPPALAAGRGLGRRGGGAGAGCFWNRQGI